MGLSIPASRKTRTREREAKKKGPWQPCALFWSYGARYGVPAVTLEHSVSQSECSWSPNLSWLRPRKVLRRGRPHSLGISGHFSYRLQQR